MSWDECRRVMESPAFAEAIQKATAELLPLLREPPAYLDLPVSHETIIRK